MKYLHTNIVSKDAKKLANFYINVFECKQRSEGHMSGEWLDKAINLTNADISSIELTLPGYFERYPYIEIFQYSEMVESNNDTASNLVGFAHLSFEVDDVKLIMEKAIQYGASKHGDLTKKEFKSGILT